MASRLGRVGLMVGLCALYGALALSAAAAAEDGSDFIGHWHWDKAHSTLPPGETAPASMEADITHVGPLHVRWTFTVTDAQGKAAVERFDEPANGEFYPISPGTDAAIRLLGRSLQATFKGPDGEIDSLTCTVAENRSRMTCNGSLTANGKTDSYVDIYDREG